MAHEYAKLSDGVYIAGRKKDASIDADKKKGLFHSTDAIPSHEMLDFGCPTGMPDSNNPLSMQTTKRLIPDDILCLTRCPTVAYVLTVLRDYC